MLLVLSNEETNLTRIGLFCQRFSPPHKTFRNLRLNYLLLSHNPLPQNQIHSKNQQKIDQLFSEQLADLPQLIDHKFRLPAEVGKEKNAEKEKTVSLANNLDHLASINRTLEMSEAKIIRKILRNLMSLRVNTLITVEREKGAEKDSRSNRQNYDSGADRIKLQDRYFNARYIPPRNNCNTSRNRSPYNPNYPSSRQRQYSQERNCYRNDRNVSNKRHVPNNSPNHNYGRNRSPSPYAYPQRRNPSHELEHYIISEKAPKEILIRVSTQDVRRKTTKAPKGSHTC
jgi:hypothetical protein